MGCTTYLYKEQILFALERITYQSLALSQMEGVGDAIARGYCEVCTTIGLIPDELTIFRASAPLLIEHNRANFRTCLESGLIGNLPERHVANDGNLRKHLI